MLTRPGPHATAPSGGDELPSCSPAQFAERMRDVIASLRGHYANPAHEDHAVDVICRSAGERSINRDLGLP